MPSSKPCLSFYFFLMSSGFLTATAVAYGAQLQGADPASLPTQPAALMDLIAQRNALEVESLKPWRMVIRVHVADAPADGKTGNKSGDTPPVTPAVVGAGREIRIEETWVSSLRFKTSYQLGDQAWQVYGSASGSMMMGQEAPGADFWSQALREFAGPVPNEKMRTAWVLQEKDQALGNAKLKCLSVTGLNIKGETRPTAGSTYCIDADRPNLRVSANPLSQSQTVRNGLRIFEGQYVPEKVELTRNGTVIWRAELETLELMPQVDEAALVAPPEAKPVIRKVQISAAVAQGQLVSQVRPVYPPLAMSNGIQGMVVLQGRISKEGNPINLRVVSGNEQLQMAALDAVRQWRYKPYLLNGEPVEVETTINVVFHLGR
jgi:TonB family protein